jgi:hypothetical protein
MERPAGLKTPGGWEAGGVANKESEPGGKHADADAGSVTLRVPLPGRVAADLAALAELYHATPEQMAASWVRTHVENLMAALTPGGAPPQPQTQTQAQTQPREQP